MNRFCKDLREDAMKIIDYEKKEIILLTYKNKSVLRKAESLLHM